MCETRKDIFIKKAILKHGDVYDYSKVEYVDSKTKVCIVCPEHGEFWQAPAAHVRGNKCPYCANKKRGDTRRWNKDDFVYKAILVHGTKYTYENVDYINNNTKVNITCPIHGSFYQTPLAHVFGKCGCPKCAGRNNDTESIIEQFKLVHGDIYDYSEVVFTKMFDKVKIICPEHGEFWQTPEKHLSGQKCPKCSKREGGLKQRLSKENFIERSNEIYNGKYDYSKVEYKTSHDKVEIICPEHGSFYQRPYDHLNGHACPRCGLNVSYAEDELYEYICVLIGSENVIRRDRSVLGDGRELDIYIPSMKIAFEYDGLKWHSEEFGKDRYYHITKTELCEKNSITLIHIFEDEYLYHKEIVQSKISYILGKSQNLIKVMARKCYIKDVDINECRAFLNKNHIQGYSNSTVSIGAYYGDKLIGVMCFTKTGKQSEWILNRFACDINTLCSGLGGKLFNYFVRKYNPEVVKSFLDRRWCTSMDNLYTKIGFTLDGILKPDYRYISKVSPNKRIHKFNLRKKELHRKYNMDMSKTEAQMAKELNLVKIWDCGLYRYIWKKENAA